MTNATVPRSEALPGRSQLEFWAGCMGELAVDEGWLADLKTRLREGADEAGDTGGAPAQVAPAQLGERRSPRMCSERPRRLAAIAEWASADPGLSASALEASRARAREANGALNAFISLPLPATGGPAADTGAANGLDGVRLAVKDNIHVAGFPTTCGSAAFLAHPAADAHLVGRLRAAGATVIGKTNLGELALDATTQNERFGGASNPWDVARTPGGSSGGSAAAVAAGLADLALGTDSGGSVRIPASLCGLAGYRPGGGLWGTAGIAGTPWSLDAYGLLARTVENIAYAVDACSLLPSDQAGPAGGPARIAYLADASMGRSQSRVWAQYLRAVDALLAAGHDLVAISLPGLTDAAYACMVIAFSEIAAWSREFAATRADELGEGIHATLVLGASFSAADYIAAHRYRLSLAGRFAGMTQAFDHVLTPSVPMTAPLRNVPPEIPGDDPASALLAFIRYTCLVNLLEVPSISIAGGLADDGLPVGIQLIGRAGRDRALLETARRIETAMQDAFGTDELLDEVASRWE